MQGEKTTLLSGRSTEDDQSPSSNVVKIVLFTLTGAIIAFFGAIALVGAVRVYRHPERYIPQNTAGQSMRNRAKGITRAILDTIPIVRFTEKTNTELESVELGNAKIANQIHEDVAGQTPKYSGDDSGSATLTELNGAPVLDGERGLRCSICTEDFSIGEQVRLLPCSHKYHPACIDPWLLNGFDFPQSIGRAAVKVHREGPMLSITVDMCKGWALLLWSTLASVLVADPTFTGFPPCDALIAAGLGDRLIRVGTEAYEQHLESYFCANGRLHPYCFVLPQTTEEVATTVKALASNGSGSGSWHIAVRSGGHHLPATNNIEDGVTIDLSLMNGAKYNATTNIASVQPGGRWKDVYSTLLNNGNVTVVGGRDGNVGVGGFLLGGGMSYYTPRYGLAVNTVAGFQVVLADGSIVEATATENADLWKALRGGGLNFGIVTRFDMEAMPAVDLVSGTSMITADHFDEAADAFVDFTNQMEHHRDDTMLIIHTHDSSIWDGPFILPLRVNTKGDLSTTAFDKVTQIPSVAQTWEQKSLAAAANGVQAAYGTKNAYMTLTFVNEPSVVRKAFSLHDQLASNIAKRVGSENFMASSVLQPFPTYLSDLGLRNGSVSHKAGSENGTMPLDLTFSSGHQAHLGLHHEIMSNVLGIERNGVNAVVWTVFVAIKNGQDAALSVARSELMLMTREMKRFHTSDGKAATVDYLYANYADMTQDPLGSYGPENVAFMKEVARKYDPEVFWQKRVPGGFKISRVAG
ncbi:hypothetical protein AYO20_10923 [Fonsecaea nubica]|uniref:FAD-binding PCMH-type domain-containing protein n=1 Tax=Fonsecaea nubica TaxID=856822 RepID=A0A178C1E4_9EURO|nr:hypothetical protein AYO20_10923 [Fonsecaea nubica]OAL23718.1 hypothetical protein AYO20_10923 [Fonsecaea nubica]